MPRQSTFALTSAICQDWDSGLNGALLFFGCSEDPTGIIMNRSSCRFRCWLNAMIIKMAVLSLSVFVGLVYDLSIPARDMLEASGGRYILILC